MSKLPDFFWTACFPAPVLSHDYYGELEHMSDNFTHTIHIIQNKFYESSCSLYGMSCCIAVYLHFMDSLVQLKHMNNFHHKVQKM